MKKYRKLVLLIILFLTIGFAAINTVLDINGIISFGHNEEDFNVYFYNVKKDNQNVNEIISEDKKSITVNTSDLQNVGDTSVYNYTVANTSKNYDANVKIECTTPTSESISLTNVFLNTTITAGTKEAGTLTLEYLSETTEITEYTCTLSIEAIERTVLGNEFKACEYDVGTEWTYDYTGTEQEFVVPCDGTYKVELWGAQGGNYLNTYLGGLGAYTSGNIDLPTNTTLIVTVGETGFLPTSSSNSTGTFNGGGGTIGSPAGYVYYNIGATGGGATDVRLVSGNYYVYSRANTKISDFESLKSRIMVAAGGGGSSYGNIDGWTAYGYGGYGGALIGGNGNSTYFPNGYSYGGSQIAGGLGYIATTNHAASYVNAGFGHGGGQGWAPWGGGGSGYYGGGSGGGWTGGGGGGSSYISGHEGCDAISESSTESNIIHTGQSKHYSGYLFTETNMLAGNEVMPTHDGTGTMTGNTGNGYAKITLLSID